MILPTLTSDCPKCSAKNNFSYQVIKHNILKQLCNSCKNIINANLPELNKKIIYLDQNFLSHAYRDKLINFSNISNKLIELASSQLILTPYSEVHQIETSLWNNQQKDGLWDFIRKLSRGHIFRDIVDIKKAQLLRGFNAFLKNKNKIYLLQTDAFDNDVKEWETEFYLDINAAIYNDSLINEYKKKVINELIKLIPEWRKSNYHIHDDIQIEVNALAQNIIKCGIQFVTALCMNDYNAQLNTPIESELFLSLFGKLPTTKILINKQYAKLNLIKEFLLSDHFKNVPYVKISSYLTSILKQEIRKGWLQNPDKAKNELSGTYFDIEHISVYAPYCDILFTEKRMHRWLKMMPDSVFNKSIMVFSSENIGEFDTYLNKFNARSNKIKSFIQVIYK